TVAASRKPSLVRMPWCAGCRPVRIVACDGSVSGTWLTAAVNRVASCANASSDGVSPRVDPYDPSRSARSVSIVMSTIGGRGAVDSTLAEVRPLRQAAQESNTHEISASARMPISVQLRFMHRRLASLAAGVALSCAAGVFAQPAPVFTVEDVLAVRSFAGGQRIAVSSIGRRVAYVLTDMDDEWNV